MVFSIAANACNNTEKVCLAGGCMWLFTSDKLLGNYTKLGRLFQSNETILPGHYSNREFVTPDYIGNLHGDPRNGKTRVLLVNGQANGITYFIGEGENGGALK